MSQEIQVREPCEFCDEKGSKLELQPPPVLNTNDGQAVDIVTRIVCKYCLGEKYIYKWIPVEDLFSGKKLQRPH